MSHTYIVSWDCHGLEACINISDIDKENMWAALKETDSDPDPNKGRPATVSSIVNAIVLRAKFNNQRHYEIYAIDTDDNITAEDLRNNFDNQPQVMADLVRLRGRKLYSDRVEPDKIKIR